MTVATRTATRTARRRPTGAAPTAATGRTPTSPTGTATGPTRGTPGPYGGYDDGYRAADPPSYGSSSYRSYGTSAYEPSSYGSSASYGTGPYASSYSDLDRSRRGRDGYGDDPYAAPPSRDTYVEHYGHQSAPAGYGAPGAQPQVPRPAGPPPGSGPQPTSAAPTNGAASAPGWAPPVPVPAAPPARAPEPPTSSPGQGASSSAPTQANPAVSAAPTQAAPAASSAPTQATAARSAAARSNAAPAPTRSTPRPDDAGPPTAASSLARPDTAGPRNTRVDGPAGLGADADLDDDYDDYDEDEDELSERTTAKEWAVIAGQLVVGALLGAVLWIGFSYLWQSLPVVALVLAAAATGGLVFGVRAMRRSDDLQTMVLAIVVGLVVTVSPAAFVLLAR